MSIRCHCSSVRREKPQQPRGTVPVPTGGLRVSPRRLPHSLAANAQATVGPVEGEVVYACGTAHLSLSPHRQNPSKLDHPASGLRLRWGRVRRVRLRGCGPVFVDPDNRFIHDVRINGIRFDTWAERHAVKAHLAVALHDDRRKVRAVRFLSEMHIQFRVHGVNGARILSTENYPFGEVF